MSGLSCCSSELSGCICTDMTLHPGPTSSLCRGGNEASGREREREWWGEMLMEEERTWKEEDEEGRGFCVEKEVQKHRG